jgi:cytochrome c biogenesis protein CcdA
MMVAFAFLGTNLSRRVLERMNDRSFRFWTRWTVVVLGVYYIANGVWLLVRHGNSA